MKFEIRVVKQEEKSESEMDSTHSLPSSSIRVDSLCDFDSNSPVANLCLINLPCNSDTALIRAVECEGQEKRSIDSS